MSVVFHTKRRGALLDGLIRRGRLTETGSGEHTQPITVTPAYIATACFGSNQLGERGRRDLDRYFNARRGDVPDIRNKPATRVEGAEIITLSLSEIQQCSPLFVDEGLWSANCETLFGAIQHQTPPVVVAGERSSTDSPKRRAKRRDVIHEIGPHWPIIETALQKKSGPYAWIKDYHDEIGRLYDINGIVDYLKRERLWLEHNGGIVKHKLA